MNAEVALVVSKKAALEAPPPGPGLTTVTCAVPSVAMSEASMAAVNCELLTNVVARGLPFQLTTEPLTNPVPFTVSVNPGPPGAAAAGVRG